MGLSAVIDWWHARSAPARPLPMNTLGLSALAVGLSAAGGYLLQSNALEVTHPVIPGPRRLAPPLVVALVTDLHLGESGRHTARVVAELQAYAPDVVLYGGDIVAGRHGERLVRALGGYVAPAGSFAVIGNHEYSADLDLSLLRAEYEGAGIRLLINQAVGIEVGRRRIELVGLDDWLEGGPLATELVAATARHAQRSGYDCLVLSHCPASFPEIAAGAGDASTWTFAGHTHGGQLAPFGVWLAGDHPGSGPYHKGWFTESGGRHAMYVSRGVGDSLVPFRLGRARPEIALFTL